jgi:uncharacterized membrane-anchored protein YitT (DUF2179 family)
LEHGERDLRKVAFFLFGFGSFGFRFCRHDQPCHARRAKSRLKFKLTHYPLFVVLGRDLPPLTSNTLLAALYGGITIGAGIGLVFKGGSSTGGFSLAARILEKYAGFSLGRAVLLCDATVVISAGAVFGIERAMFALIAVGVCGRTIDIVQAGFGTSKCALIISEKSDAVAQAVLHNLDRGLTRLDGAGGFSGAPREVLLVVLPRSEVIRLKVLVRECDPQAFMILSDTTEVLGQGFRPHV